MRIPCPHCGERDSRRVRLSRATPRRTPARRQDPASASTSFDYVYLRDNPRGPHREFWYHARGCRPGSSSAATRDARDLRVETRSAVATGRRDGEAASGEPSASARPYRLAAGGLVDRASAACASPSTAKRFRAIPATRWPRRCSPTACGWSAAPSNITGRAASSRPGPRSPTRWSSCARGARREPNTRATTIELFDGLEAHSQNRWPSLAFRPDRRAQFPRSRRSCRPASTTRPSCGRPPSGRRSTSR